MKYLTLTGLSRFFSNLRKIIPSKTSELQNDSGFITSQQLPAITGYSKSEVDDLLTQKATDSATVHKQGNETISGLKQFTSGLYLKHPTHSGNDAPQSNITLDGIDFTSTDKIWGQFTYKWNTDGSTSLLLSVQNYNSSNAGQTDIDFALSKDLSSCYFAPSNNNFVSLGLSNRAWKSVYANSYYYNGTEFQSKFVTTDTEQSISQVKEFTRTNSDTLRLKNGRVAIGETISSDAYTQFVFRDKNTDNLAYIRDTYFADGSTTLSFFARNKYANGAPSTTGSVSYAYWGIGVDATGKPSASVRGDFAPYSDATYNLGSSSNKWKSVYSNAYYLGNTQFGDIVTHNVSEYAPSSHTHSQYLTNTDNCVHTTGAETVAGEKTFTTSPILSGNIAVRFDRGGTVGTNPSSTMYYQSLSTRDTNSTTYYLQRGYITTGGTNAYTWYIYNWGDTSNSAYTRLEMTLAGVSSFKASVDNLVPVTNDATNLGTSGLRWKSVYASSYYLGATAFGDIVTHNASEFLTSHQTVSNSAPTLAWGTTSTIGTIGGTALTVKMPANPNTNTTYSAGTGLSLSGTTFSLALTKALVTDALGYTPPTQDTNTDTKVTQTVTTGNTMYPVIAGNTANATATETNGVRFSSKLLMNTMYGYLRGLSYDSDNLKGVAPSATRTCGGSIQFYTYDGAESGRLWNEGRTGDRVTYLRVSNYITNGALSTTGTQVSNGIWLTVTNAGERKTWTDGNWACNLIPFTDNTYTLGTSSLKWKAVYATTFYGALTGNVTGDCSGSSGSCTGNAATATLATKATGNANGKELTNTIIKGLSVSGTTITYTKIDGNTGTITTQDTVYTHPTSAGNKHIPSGGSSGQFLGWDSDGTAKWVNNPNSDTKNTAGSTNTSSKIFLIGATSQAANPQTYSHDTAYVGTDGCLYSGGTKVLTAHQSLSNYSTLANTVKSLSISGKTITVTPGSGDAYTLTTQDTTYSNFVKSGSGAKAGLVPSPGTTAGTTKYLREDGTWQVPPDHTYTVNNATLTIQKNGSNVATFTSNASSNVTANITVPTKTSEITNDSGFITSSSSITGNAANVTGTVAIANGGTGATTRLNAVKALTNENVGTDTDYFLTITSSWGKAGYCSVANAKTVLGLGSGAYTDAYVHPTTAGNKHIPSGGSSGQILKYSSSGTAVWADANYINTMDEIASRTTVGNGTWSISCTAHQLMIIAITSKGSNVVVQHLVNVTLTSGASSLVPEHTTALFSHSSTTASATLTKHILLWATANTVKITISDVTNLSTLTLHAYQ